jgi:hypothetical protein
MKEVIETNPFQSTHFAWINFCIERMGFKNLIRLDEALSVKRDKFSTCYIDYIPESLVNNTAEYFKMGRCGMCSGFFTGNETYMYNVCDLIENKFLEYLHLGYGHADEQLYTAVYFQNTDLFEHYYGDYQQMITNYVYIYDAPEPPIYNFIKRSYENSNHIKCYEGCKFVFNSWALGKCEINENYFGKGILMFLDKFISYTDNLLDRIRYTTTNINAKKILEQIDRRELYEYVGEIIFDGKNEEIKQQKNSFHALRFGISMQA